MGFRNRESDVLSACLQWLRWKGVFCWRQNQGAIPLGDGGYRKFVGLKGVSDILGILPETVRVVGVERPVMFGNLLAVEVKRWPHGAEMVLRRKALTESAAAIRDQSPCSPRRISAARRTGPASLARSGRAAQTRLSCKAMQPAAARRGAQARKSARTAW